MPPSAKPWHGLCTGVYELVDEHASGTCRCVFIVRFSEGIYVLHAFQKKSERGRKTPQADIALIEARPKSLVRRRGVAKDERQGMSKSPKVPSGNVLVDLGFPDAEELSAKTTLALRLNWILDRRALIQVEAARVLGMTQAKVSALRNCRLRGISLERLMQALVALDQNVDIVVRPRGRSKTPAAIRVAA